MFRMKLRLLILILSSAALLCGCVATVRNECDWSKPIMFDNTDVIDWISRNDPRLLADIVAHNEKVDRICH